MPTLIVQGSHTLRLWTDEAVKISFISEDWTIQYLYVIIWSCLFYVPRDCGIESALPTALAS